VNRAAWKHVLYIEKATAVAARPAILIEGTQVDLGSLAWIEAWNKGLWTLLAVFSLSQHSCTVIT